MSAHAWSDVKRIFHAAIELPESERADFIARAGAGNEALQADVKSLVAHHIAAGGPEPPSLQTVARVFENAETQSRVGQRVGAYELTRLIASGGMGHVYLGRRADGQFEKQVAVKIIRHGIDGDELHRRFLNEQQALAALDHPNIARLLDGGVTADGLSYLVMEYVEGRPIDEFCDEQRLTTDQRLELFQTVCAAVHYAHQRLVIHRDLKPANILVAADGTPKLLDFGIAKLVDHRDGATTIPAARLTVPFLTPEYASPEQIRGEPITTASDVYSLGVILYELLTGRRPHRPEGRSQQALARQICEREPPRPSTAVRQAAGECRGNGTLASAVAGAGIGRGRDFDADALSRRLSGDLDNICLRALRKEPHRRYGSAQQLAEDVRRHRAGLPVIARKDTFTYRAAKFVRRNRAAVVVAAVLALSLVGGIIGTSAALVAVRRAQHKTQLMNDFLKNMLAQADVNNVGRDLTVGEMLDRAAGRVGNDFSEHPDVEAGLHAVIGNAYLSLSLPQARQHLERALELQRSLHGEEHPDVAGSLHDLAVCALVLGRLDDAERYARQALELQHRLTGEIHEDYVDIVEDLAVILRTRGDLSGAEPLYKKALALNRHLFGPHHIRTARTLNNYAVLLKNRGELDRAEQFYRESAEIRREHLADHHELATTLSNLAALLQARGDNAGAEPLYREALQIQLGLLGEDHPSIAITRNNLAMLLLSCDRLDEAQSHFEAALAVNRERLGEKHPQIGTLLSNLGSVFRRRGDYERAEGLYRQAFEIRRAALGEEHPDIATSIEALGGLYVQLGRFDEAEDMLNRSLAMRRRLFPKGNAVVALSLEELSRLASARHRHDEAEAQIRRALEERIRLQGEGHVDVTATRVRLASVLIDQGRHDEALPLLASAIPAGTPIATLTPRVQIEALRELGRYHAAAGNQSLARQYLNQALQRCAAGLGEAHPDTARIRVLLDDLNTRAARQSASSLSGTHGRR